MGIAIKKLTNEDIAEFEKFLKTERADLPDLRLSPLAYPHEDMAVIAFKRNSKTRIHVNSLKQIAEKYQFVLTEHDEHIISLSKHAPIKQANNSSYIFSGYAFYNDKMLIGVNEVAEQLNDIGGLREAYGEFNLCQIGHDNIECSADFFGMAPWFYFENERVFTVSNNYHLMLVLLADLQMELSMNIPHSRVNMITSGFTYGSTFSDDLDVSGCKINYAYESIRYSSTRGGVTLPTSLWDIMSDNSKWDENLYEEYIFKAKQELLALCKAAFEHQQFSKVVIDVSGGFDSRIVFALACELPQRLRRKIYTHTRRSGTSDDVEKASAVTNLYNYPKYAYAKTDTSELFAADGSINLAQVSRTLGSFAVNSYLYTNSYDDMKTLEITGYLGEVVLGYKRCRGELDYSLGDRRLLARLGGCYLHNSVDELQEVFKDQENIINQTLSRYTSCDCLFKKFQLLYVDSRNRFICNSSRNIENNNLRIPMLFSKYAMKAKWLYFNKFANNAVPDEKVSVDLLSAINPMLAALPFAANNDDVLPKAENLLNPVAGKVVPDNTIVPGPKVRNAPDIYKDKVIEYIDDLDVVEKMLLHIFDYSDKFYSVCLGIYKVLTLLRAEPSEIKTGHARETIRKVYDIYYQIRLVEQSNNK